MPPPHFRADSPVQPWLSAAAARDTVAALETEAGPERPWMTGFFLGLIVAGLLALVTVHVDVIVRTWGIIRTRTENIELRSPATASVDRVLVGTGARVVAGQPLLVLANPALQARRNTLAVEHAHQLHLAAEWAALNARGHAVQAGISLQPDEPSFGSDWARRQWEEGIADDGALAHAAGISRRTYERIDALAARGLVSAQECEGARDAARADDQARTLARSRRAAAWTAQQRDAERLVAKLTGELRQVEEELGLLTLRAPVDGVVMDLVSLRPGAVVAASQSLGTISTDDEFRVEARVPARVYALLHPGHRARLSVTALPATEWGLMGADVESLAPDVTSGNAEPAYRVVLRPHQDGLQTRDGRWAALRKGFIAEVRFELGRATLLTLLRRNVSDWLTGDPRMPDRPLPDAHARAQPFSSNPVHRS